MTEAEKVFLTMARIADVRNVMIDDAIRTGFSDVDVANKGWDQAVAKVHEAFVSAVQIGRFPHLFPVVASTFEALTIERPELREHYDRAKQAWEASQ